MDKNIIPVESIQERDVDMILLEELNSDDTFCKWFVDELSLPPLSEVKGAWKSISDFGLGETDILFCYNSFGKSIFVLIENKLDASFQDEQYVRYTKRADNYMAEKKCNEVYVALFAPNQYCKSQSDFERFIPYESVLEQMQETSSKRGLFKSELLQIAIDKQRRGYTVQNHKEVQQFWFAYWEYLKQRYSEFEMKRPTIVPKNSDWPILKNDKIPSVKFYHKLSQGHADVQFNNLSEEQLSKLEQLPLSDEITLLKLNKVYALRLKVEKVDRFKYFHTQQHNIDSGLLAFRKLKNLLIDTGIF